MTLISLHVLEHLNNSFEFIRKKKKIEGQKKVYDFNIVFFFIQSAITPVSSCLIKTQEKKNCLKA